MTAPFDAIDVFVSYSHRDADLRRGLEAHLAPLRRQGAIRNWWDGRIAPGEEWEKETEAIEDR